MRPLSGRNVARRELLGVTLITLLAAILRFYRLDAIPPGFHFDEAYEALEAWRVITAPGYHPIFFTGNFGVDPLFVYLTSIAFRLFAPTPQVMRGVAALLGTLTVPLIYGLGREVVAWRAGARAAAPLLAAFVLATMRWHIHYSRVGIEPILIPLELTVLLWAFWRGVRTGGLGAWLVVAAATASGLYTYPAGRLFPLVVLMLLALVLLMRPAMLRQQGRSMLLAGLVAVILTLPVGWNWLQHPDQFLLRSSQIAAGVGDTVGVGPAHNLQVTLAMFNFKGDLDPRNNLPGAPALDVLLSIPFFLGLLIVARHWRQPIWPGLLGAGLILLLPTILSEYAPHFRRAVGATPIVALLCGVGLAAILGDPEETRPDIVVPWRVTAAGADPDEAAVTLRRLRSLGRRIVVAFILIGSAVLSVTGYFGHWARDPALFYAYDEGLWEIGGFVRDLPEGAPVLISPRPATDMTLAFAWRDGSRVRHFDGRHAFLIPAALSGGAPAYFIIIEHEDFRGSDLLQQLFPQAEQSKLFTDSAGAPYARVWRVPAGATPARQPLFPANARWPDIRLLGYDLNRETYQPGEIVYLQLWWQAEDQPTTDWTVFTHITDSADVNGGAVRAGSDARPGQGSVPTTSWRPGDLILDEYQIRLPDDLPPGEYPIEVGWYDLAGGGARAVTLDPPGQDHVVLGTIEVQ